jgi:hypothetical protein
MLKEEFKRLNSLLRDVLDNDLEPAFNELFNGLCVHAATKAVSSIIHTQSIKVFVNGETRPVNAVDPCENFIGLSAGEAEESQI